MPVRQMQQLTLTQRLTLEIRRDKKRAAILGILLVVAVVVGVRTAATMSGGGAAKAAAAPAAAPGARGVVPTSVLSGGRAESLALRDWKPSRLTDGSIQRDPFGRDLSCYAKVLPDPPAQPDKPAEALPDPRLAREELERATLAQAAGLSLQSTMVGPDSSAILNGSVLHVGQWASGFQVVDIQSGSIVLERGGVRVLLGIDAENRAPVLLRQPAEN